MRAAAKSAALSALAWLLAYWATYFALYFTFRPDQYPLGYHVLGVIAACAISWTAGNLAERGVRELVS